jgi:hypothetical protein
MDERQWKLSADSAIFEWYMWAVQTRLHQLKFANTNYKGPTIYTNSLQAHKLAKQPTKTRYKEASVQLLVSECVMGTVTA